MTTPKTTAQRKGQGVKSKSNTIAELLKEFDEQSRGTSLSSGHWNDRALWHLLEMFKDKLPALDGYFHKAFRQDDVTDSGHTDMAIWCLLQKTDLFWELFEQAQKGKLPRLEHPNPRTRAGK